MRAFLDLVDVVTLEWENVPVAAVEQASATAAGKTGRRGSGDHPGPVAREDIRGGAGYRHRPLSRDRRPRSRSRRRCSSIGPRTILKTRRLGYDGKGQVLIDAGTSPAEALAALQGAPAILEGFVAFERELSVITARRPNGEIRSFPPVENRHAQQILVETTAPAEIPADIATAATAIAERIAQALGLEGLLAVEMFLSRDGTLMVNELAPRPHNSGHWSIDAGGVSQFEQLVRAICDLPLGDPQPLAPAVMRNLLGADIESWPADPGNAGCASASLRQARGEAGPQDGPRDLCRTARRLAEQRRRAPSLRR